MQRIHLLVLVCVVFLKSSSYCASFDSVPFIATTNKPQEFQVRSLDQDDDFEAQAQTHLTHHQQQQQQQQQQQELSIYDYSQSEEDVDDSPLPVSALKQSYQTRQKVATVSKNKGNRQSTEEESEEEEEPDRLSLLLTKSSFACNGKTTGYYADESLNCEVFHYCQENQRHSWICPEGFTFHQIHLICMPPSHENICQQSSKFHIVNDYLYKPVNLQEHQTKPNVTLRYSERYYPDHYYERAHYSEEDDDEPAPRQRVHHKQPIQIGFQQQSQQLQTRHQPQQQQQQQQRERDQQQKYLIQQQIRHQQSNAGNSDHQLATTSGYPSSLYRKTTYSSSTAIPMVPATRTQTQTPVLVATPTPYRFFTSSPQLQHIQQQQQQVFRTPEEINISLQQRRPQLFIASTTPRYYEDEYLYERK